MVEMYCSQCGAQNPVDASFCRQCGKPLVQPSRAAEELGHPAQAGGELAGLGPRAASLLVDGILQAIPYVNLVTVIVNWIMYRLGNTIGLKLIGARIVRENGDLSGFFHTFVRAGAASLSAIPLGLGYWWAFWDPRKQT